MPQQASQAHTSNSSHHKLLKQGVKIPQNLKTRPWEDTFERRKKFLVRQQGGWKVEIVKHEQKV